MTDELRKSQPVDGVNKRKGWRWADDKMHDSPPPSSEHMPTPAETPAEPARGAEAVRILARSEVPASFAHTPRTLLRVQALDFALRSTAIAAYPHKRPSGEEILQAAEEIERWICQSQS